MKKFLVAMLAVILSAIPVLAGEFPVEAAPGNSEPQIYLIKKIFDICNPAEDVQDTGHCELIPGQTGNCAPLDKDTCLNYPVQCVWVPDKLTPAEAWGRSGSTPYGDQTIQYGGCKDSIDEKRLHQYAFTGEQILELVVVRDLNGGIDILGADVVVDGYTEAKCNDVTDVFWFHGGLGKRSWFGHDVGGLLETTPPAKGPADEEGLDPTFDRLFECVLTVEPSWYGASPSTARLLTGRLFATG